MSCRRQAKWIWLEKPAMSLNDPKGDLPGAAVVSGMVAAPALA
jgi:hypothetical protein